mmetsp:Transcript_19555/g.21747  ORF Transcript_19555/g.21747 Transcript_19555/m.21747 type:complete len:174 (+) Transcript_19555:41-562(+)
MSIVYDTFVASCNKLVEKSAESREDAWELRDGGSDCCYNCKKYLARTHVLRKLQSDEDTPTFCYFDYFIVYSSTYTVPVLYFNVYNLDGSLLTPEEFRKSLPQHLSNEKQKWNFITQDEHPITGVPCNYIHPCQTQQVMEQLLQGAATSDYLLTWLSMYGAFVGITVKPQWLL